MALETAVEEESLEDLTRAHERTELYALLAMVFLKEPDAKLLDTLQTASSSGVWDLLGEVAFPEYISRLTAEDNQQAALEALACEYTRLFVGPGPHFGPFESLHREDQPRVHWGKVAAEIKQQMEFYGLTYTEDNSVMFPDHISVEFQFMSMLANEEAEALKASDHEAAANASNVQRKFFQEHINKWVPAFCDQVSEATDLPFYANFIRLAKQVCEREAEIYGEN